MSKKPESEGREQSFTITEEIIPKEELSATVVNLDNQVKSVNRLSGSMKVGNMGEICSLKTSIHEKVAVKLNGEYHLAFFVVSLYIRYVTQKFFPASFKSNSLDFLL